MNWFLLFLIYVQYARGVDVSLSFEDYSGDVDIRSIYTSFEAPVGYTPTGTYWCVAAWWGGYFGVQRAGNGSYNYITSVWNQGKYSAKINMALPGGVPADCQNESYCVEGAVAHDLIFSDPWQPGVRYDFMVNYEVEGEKKTLSSYVFKDDRWMLITQFQLPHFQHYLGNYVYQFLENPSFNSFDWTWRAETARFQKRGLYYNQHIRKVGSDKWLGVTNFWPDGNKPGNKTHDEFYEYFPLPNRNGYMLVLDGAKPGTEKPGTYNSHYRANTSNLEPPLPLNWSPKGKHTVTMTETYLGFKVATDSPITTTTTKQTWVTNTKAAEGFTLTSTELLTTVETVISRATKTEVHTVTLPTNNVTEFTTETEVNIEVDTVTESAKPEKLRSVTDLTTEASTVTIYDRIQSTVYAPAITVFKNDY
ncbi:hypothetical protein K7432_008537 [Basidiobolus ranarum]|uniref:Uncharacterized protein n=1 Tax=Basidiobolus ranarum TaxID=34480 RepID=A0ABR2VYL8_9FUNG